MEAARRLPSEADDLSGGQSDMRYALTRGYGGLRCEGLFAEVVLEIHKLRTGNKHHDGYCRDDTEQEVHLSALGCTPNQSAPGVHATGKFTKC